MATEQSSATHAHASTEDHDDTIEAHYSALERMRPHARAKCGICSGCARRFRRREVVECVEGSHDNLTYFDGDNLCWTCADAAGVEH